MISIVIPAYNEEENLEKSIRIVENFLKNNRLDDEFKIIIADNASTDKTKEISKKLCNEFDNLVYFYVFEQGKGNAVISAWQNFPANINIFMDADLATDLSALPNLVKEVRGGANMAVGSRREKHSVVSRTFKRKIISLGLNFLLKLVLRTTIMDTACGFKGIDEQVLEKIVPQIKNKTWFFDTEMLILGERLGYKIKEIPIVWEEADRESRVKISQTIKDYLKEIWRLK
jgi:glycosyltransferase involved in cell wall biosynthesis